MLGLTELISDLENVVVSLSGGPRDYLAPLTLASSFNGGNVKKVYLRSDINNSLTELELPEASVRLDSNEKEVISLIDQEENINITNLAGKLGISQSTASRRVNKLSGKDLVKLDTKEEGKIVSPSLKALISLRY